MHAHPEALAFNAPWWFDVITVVMLLFIVAILFYAPMVLPRP